MDIRQYKNEKGKRKLERAKFYFGTVVLGLTTMIVNYQIQDYKLRITDRKNEADILKEQLQIYIGASKTKKDDFLEFMKTVSSDTLERDRYNRLWLKSTRTERLKDSLQVVRDSMRITRNTLQLQISRKEIEIKNAIRKAEKEKIDKNQLEEIILRKNDSIQSLLDQIASLENYFKPEYFIIHSLLEQIAEQEKDGVPREEMVVWICGGDGSCTPYEI